MKHNGTITLNTERLTLRKFKESDYFSLYENYAKDEENTKFMSWPNHDNNDVSKAVVLSWIRQYIDPKFYQWAIVLKDNPDDVIGSISLVSHDSEPEKLEVGFCLSKKYWRKGYMSEALKEVLRYAFETLEVEAIIGETLIDNIPSQNMFKKFGFKYIGNVECYFPLRNLKAECKHFELYK